MNCLSLNLRGAKGRGKQELVRKLKLEKQLNIICC